MQQTFTFSRLGVVVRHWTELLDTGEMEHGSRTEVPMLDPQSHRGSPSASQRLVIDRPIFRADVFDLIEDVPGRYARAHLHSSFSDNEPCERMWDPLLSEDPWKWLTGQLEDVASCSIDEADIPEADVIDVRAAAALIVAAARSVASDRCLSAEQCLSWTRESEACVRGMMGLVLDPNNLDMKRLSVWIEGR